MPVIRISDSTWERLKSWAEPLEDTAEDVIQKVLNVAENHKPAIQKVTNTSFPNKSSISIKGRKVFGRIPIGQRTPIDSYRLPILESLSEMGGTGRSYMVLQAVEKKLKNTLKEVDYQKISTGQIRWENCAQWARKLMVDEGLIEPTEKSGRGMWRLSKEGYSALEKR